MNAACLISSKVSLQHHSFRSFCKPGLEILWLGAAGAPQPHLEVVQVGLWGDTFCPPFGSLSYSTCGVCARAR